MSNIIIESVNSKIPFTIDDLFEHTFIIIFAFAFAFAFVSVTGSILLSKFIGVISKNIKDFFNQKSKQNNKTKK